MRKLVLLFYVLVLPIHYLHAKCSTQINRPVQIDSLEVRIAQLFKIVKNEKNNKTKLEKNREIIQLFRKALILDTNCLYPFNSLKYVGKILAPDSSFRLITWNIPMDNGTQRYSGFIQYPFEKNIIKPVFLNNNNGPSLNETDNYPGESWYGALYYKIIPDTCNHKYLILGLDLTNFFTSRKIIDVISVDKENVTFGAPIFKTDQGIQKRVIFEYSARLSMLLRFDEKTGKIVFDHLSPSDPQYTGQYQFYGPDSSYDGFQQKNCTWELVKDLNLKNETH